MTIMIDKPLTEADDKPDALLFPPEHYGCPPWCTVNTEHGTNHDSADGMPGKPTFAGYHHWTARYVPYASAPANPPHAWPEANPLCVHLGLDTGSSEPGIALSGCATDDGWTEFTLGEAAELAALIGRLAATGSQPCPSWCAHEHQHPEDDWHQAKPEGIVYASAPVMPNSIVGHRNPYGVDLYQAAPQIILRRQH
jgi:hypothetical protein